ncbi:MAG: RagB/SusD family nutrient uptake outer membrane protein [Bacteroidaceae bacterium]|nr:RagB/SusD family nutrient uptake outer membrane protein [Bacteroidaceae bacterium]
MKIKSFIVPCLILTATASMTVSCEDMLTQDSDNVIYADNEHLIDATDTIYSVTGIINKLQNIADRTVLLGELRGDLVDVTSATSSDLRDVALFNVGDSNIYNSPKDYYSVINNCNYFLAKADTALKNNRNEKIFKKEYAAVKAYRAWTYLQLVINYGKVPFVTEPILSKADAEKTYPKKDIKGICDYFIQDIAPYADVDLPTYGSIRGADSHLFFMPVYVVLGDLNLWAGNYKDAAWSYYKYIDFRTLNTGMNKGYWDQNEFSYRYPNDSYSDLFYDETYNSNSDIVSIIPMDSCEAEGNYSKLRELYNAQEANNYTVSIVPSTALFNLSESQKYCNYSTKGVVSYAPTDLEKHKSGDLRLYSSYYTSSMKIDKKTTLLQHIYKFSSRNVFIYRKTGIYLRMAEALNRAGFPRFAYEILSTGLNNASIQKDVLPYYPSDSLWIKSFNFPNTEYVTNTAENNQNTQGVHSRGSGYSQYNEYYKFPTDTTILDSLSQQAYQVEKVEDMIMDENALETSFEGYRFYDLMRVALRRNDPSYLSKRVYNRKGSENYNTMFGTIKSNLNDVSTWYLKWKGQIGY